MDKTLNTKSNILQENQIGKKTTFSERFPNKSYLLEQVIKKIENLETPSKLDEIKQILDEYEVPSPQINFDPFLSKSSLNKKIEKIQMKGFLQLNDNCLGELELDNGNLAFWTKENIQLINYNNNTHKMQVIESIYHKTDNHLFCSSDFATSNDKHLIYVKNAINIRIWDKKFNIIQEIKQDECIVNFCNLSSTCFAITLRAYGDILIYSRRENDDKYQLKSRYIDEYDGEVITSLICVSKYDLILFTSSKDDIGLYNFSQDKLVNRYSNRKSISLISHNDDMFTTNEYDGIISLWLIIDYSTIKFIKSVDTLSNLIPKNCIFDSLMENDISLVKHNRKEIEIWDIESSKSIESIYLENSDLYKFPTETKIYWLKALRNGIIIALTYDRKLIYWNILD